VRAREAREAGVAGRARCKLLFLGDSITEAFRGTQFGETYDELKPRRKARCVDTNDARPCVTYPLTARWHAQVFEEHFGAFGARAFGISGDRTQHLLWRIQNGELQFRHSPEVVCICVGTNNLGRDGDGAEDTYLGIYAVIQEVLHRLPGTRILLPGVLPRGPGAGPGATAAASMLPGAPGVSAEYQFAGSAAVPPAAHAAPDVSKFGQPGLFTPTIHEVNRRLAAFAATTNGAVTFLDCEACFLAQGGASIIPALMRDALHPTAKGMLAWFRVLKPRLAQLAAAPASRHAEAVSHGAHAEAAAAAADAAAAAKAPRAKL
jgi:lysophospholipase L1-like esterase